MATMSDDGSDDGSDNESNNESNNEHDLEEVNLTPSDDTSNGSLDGGFSDAESEPPVHPPGGSSVAPIEIDDDNDDFSDDEVPQSEVGTSDNQGSTETEETVASRTIIALNPLLSVKANRDIHLIQQGAPSTDPDFEPSEPSDDGSDDGDADDLSDSEAGDNPSPSPECLRVCRPRWRKLRSKYRLMKENVRIAANVIRQLRRTRWAHYKEIRDLKERIKELSRRPGLRNTTVSAVFRI